MKKILLLLFFFSSLASATPVLDVHTWKTSTGTPVYFAPSKSAPMVDVALIFNAGSAYDGDMPGLAMLTNSLFGESTKDWNATQIAERFARIGAIFTNDASKSMAVLGFRSLNDRKKLLSALDTFTQVVTDPDFPSQAVTRIKQQMLVSLTGQEQDPESIATKTLMSKMFGDTPYGHDQLGTAKNIADLSRSDVQDFYHTYYVAQNAFIAIVGDVSQTEAQKIAEHIISRLPTGSSAAPAIIPDNIAATMTAVNFPSTQNHIRMGEISIGRSDPNYIALAVGNYILGTGFTSRLFQQVRDQRGLSYYTGSSLIALPTKSLFVISLQTKNSSTNEAIQVTKQTLAQFIQQGPTEKELAEAKRSIIGSFPLMFDSNQSILSCLVTLAFFHLPLNYYDNYREKIQAVTTAQVKAAFQKTISLDHLAIVSVGGK